MKATDHLAAVAALRQLAGRDLPLHQRIADVLGGIDRLQAGTRAWSAFAPRRAVLDEAIAQTDAVARSLRELRQALHSQGGPTGEAA